MTRPKSKFNFELEGNQKSQIMVIFMHGFPDTKRLWDPIIADLDKNHIMIVNISYHAEEYFGIDFAEIISRYQRTIDSVDGGRNLKKLFVGHDWGSFFTYLIDYQSPSYIDEFISLDVTPTADKNMRAIFFGLGYQIFFIFNWLIHVLFPCFFIIPIILMHLFTRFLLNKKYEFWAFNPAKMAYPYIRLYLGGFASISWLDKNIRRYKPTCPVTYIYGKDKPLQFHSTDFLKTIAENPRNKVIPVNGGHWVTDNHRDLIVSAIKDAIKRLTAVKS